MNIKERYYPAEHRDYSLESRRNHFLETSLRRSYIDGQQSYLMRQRQDAEVLADYELKREREKVIVLEERLKNKQIFIMQMKQFQKELSKAFDESQEELKYFKLKCEDLEDVDIKGYLQEIEQLKKSLTKSQSQRRQLQKQLKKHIKDEFRQKQSSRRSLKHAKTTIEFGERSERNKANNTTFATQFYRSFENYSLEEVLASGGKFGTFCNHFLDMVNSCNPGAPKSSLKEMLKFSWKWVKDIVRNYNHDIGYLKETQGNQYSNEIKKLFNYRSTKEIVPIIEDVLKENKEYKKVIDQLIDYYKIGKETSLKQIAEFIKKKKQKKDHKQ